MYRIAMCDEQEEDLERMEELLFSYRKRQPGIVFAAECFKSAEELLAARRERNYEPDLLLLEACLTGKSGVLLAYELREQGYAGKLVFITASKEYALDAFRVDASQYLMKPATEEALFPVLDRIFEKAAGRRGEYLVLRLGGRFCRIAVDDILYCEAQGKKQVLHLAGGVRQLHMTMKKLYEMLSDYPQFARAGISHIVNMAHVASMTAQDMCMDNGETIYLPRGIYQQLCKQYAQYYFLKL